MSKKNSIHAFGILLVCVLIFTSGLIGNPTSESSYHCPWLWHVFPFAISYLSCGVYFTAMSNDPLITFPVAIIAWPTWPLWMVYCGIRAIFKTLK